MLTAATSGAKPLVAGHLLLWFNSPQLLDFKILTICIQTEILGEKFMFVSVNNIKLLVIYVEVHYIQ